MVGKIHRLAMIGAAALAPLALVTVVSPGVSNADRMRVGHRVRSAVQHLRGGTAATAATAASATRVER